MVIALIFFDYTMTITGINVETAAAEGNPLTQLAAEQFGLNSVVLMCAAELAFVMLVYWRQRNWLAMSAVSLLGFAHWFAGLSWVHRFSFVYDFTFSGFMFWTAVFAMPLVVFVAMFAYSEYPIMKVKR